MIQSKIFMGNTPSLVHQSMAGHKNGDVKRYLPDGKGGLKLEETIKVNFKEMEKTRISDFGVEEFICVDCLSVDTRPKRKAKRYHKTRCFPCQGKYTRVQTNLKNARNRKAKK